MEWNVFVVDLLNKQVVGRADLRAKEATIDHFVKGKAHAFTTVTMIIFV
jgi:hypothetical protein